MDEFESDNQSESQYESDSEDENEISIHQCVQEGDINKLKCLLPHCPHLWDQIDEQNRTPIDYLLTYNQPEIFYYLSRYDYPNISKSFYRCCQKSNLPELKRITEFAIFGINQHILNCGTLEALIYGNFDVVDYFVNNQFDGLTIELNIKDYFHEIYRETSFLEILCGFGSNNNMDDKKQEIYNETNLLKSLNYLLPKLSINDINRDILNCLDCAITLGYSKIVELLFQYNINTNENENIKDISLNSLIFDLLSKFENEFYNLNKLNIYILNILK